MTNHSTPRKAASALKIFALICVAGAIVVFALASFLGISLTRPAAPARDKGSTPSASKKPVVLKFPRTYLGKWQSRDGTILWIKSDGKADFHAGDTDVSGGILIVDEKKKVLKISSVFDISKQWKIERGPTKKPNGETVIKLNGEEFKRVGSGDALESDAS